MRPYRKPFFGDPLFPFEMTYRKKRFQEDELPEHLHDRYELVYIHEGTGTFFINQTLYDMKPGDLFAIPGNTIHRSFTAPDDPIVSTAVFFAPSLVRPDPFDVHYSALGCYELARKRNIYKFELPGDLQKETAETLAAIKAEWTDRKAGYRHAVRLHLQQLLLRLNRYLDSSWPGETAHRPVGPPWIREALQRIDTHPYKGIRLSELARQSNVSPAHFSRVFKQLTGMNVTDYVNAKRVMSAKEMLVDTDLSIARIAERCGFEAVPHFYRTFKAVTGVTPAQYRKEGRANRRSPIAAPVPTASPDAELDRGPGEGKGTSAGLSH